MKKYIAHSNVLGLSRGETFSSDDPFYANIAKSGIIEEVKEEKPNARPANNQLRGDEKGAGRSRGKGSAGGRRKGPGQSPGTLL